MNLVFNPVTQQDSQTNTAIARDTEDDSASMKIIALFPMLFLPAITVSNFFGLASFSPGPGGSFDSWRMWCLLVATTLPLTLVTLSIWWLWYPVSRYPAGLSNWKKTRRKRKARSTSQDEAKGSVVEYVGVSVRPKSLH
ncbi:hypothetical protein G7Y79_00010g029280 [Physcia stellaris]|nr:hypothetical protein G7Y79_00010g029280 [Physcia stellaris]